MMGATRWQEDSHQRCSRSCAGRSRSHPGSPFIQEWQNGALNRGTEVFYGLGIELKYGKTNNQTAHQKRFQGYWQCAGYKYALCRSLEDFIKVVTDYMLSVDLGILKNITSYHLSDDDTEHNKQVLNKIIKNKK